MERKENYTIEELKEMLGAVNYETGELDYIEMEDDIDAFLEMNFENDVTGLYRALAFGNFNWNDEYITLDSYGNIKTMNEGEYRDELRHYEDEIIESYEEIVGFEGE